MAEVLPGALKIIMVFDIVMYFFLYSVPMNAWEVVTFDKFSRQSRVVINAQRDLEDMLTKLERPQGNVSHINADKSRQTTGKCKSH